MKIERPHEYFPALGRALGHSPGARILAAGVVLAFFLGLAYVAWRWRDFSTTVLAAVLTVRGLTAAWRMLPIRATSRARWAPDSETADRCWPCRYRVFLWYRILMAILQCWHGRPGDPFDFHDFIASGMCLAIGICGYLSCYFFARRQPS